MLDATIERYPILSFKVGCITCSRLQCTVHNINQTNATPNTHCVLLAVSHILYEYLGYREYVHEYIHHTENVMTSNQT